MPIAISYETICALDRRPPSSAYLLFDAQPASTMPYTPSDEIARMNRKPIGRSATTIVDEPPRRAAAARRTGSPPTSISAGMKASTGASMKIGLFAAPGHRLLLHEVLDAVGDRLQQPARADAVRAVPVLDPRRDLALSQRQERGDAPVYTMKTSEHLDQRRKTNERADRPASTACGSQRPAAARAHRRWACSRRPRHRRLAANRSASVTSGRAGRACRTTGRRSRRARAASAANTSAAAKKPLALADRREQVAEHVPARTREARARPSPAVKRCTRPRRFVNVPSSSAMFAIGSTTSAPRRPRGHRRCRRRSMRTPARQRRRRRRRAPRRRRRARRPSASPSSSASTSRRSKPSSSAPTTFAARSRRSARSGTPASGASGPVATGTRPARRCDRRAARAGQRLVRAASATRGRTRDAPASSARRLSAAPRPSRRRATRGHPWARAAHVRQLDAVAAVQPAVVEPPVSQMKYSLTSSFGARPQAHDRHCRASRAIDVAALRAVRADRGRAVELPRARLVQEVLGEQRADRAEVDDVAGPRVRRGPAPVELADHRAVAALADVEHRRPARPRP